MLEKLLKENALLREEVAGFQVAFAKQEAFYKEQLAERDDTITLLLQVIEGLKERVIALEAKLNTNSSNSSKPPSTDPPWKAPKKQTGTGSNKKGGQPGHKGVARELLPVEDVDDIVICKPAETCGCGGLITLNPTVFERKQVFELPVIRPHVTEFQIFTGCCTECSCKCRGSLPVGTPSGMLGPRALATVSCLTGRFQQSKRDAAEFFCDLFNLSISLGSVCNAEQQMSGALKTPHEELAAAIPKEPVVGMDETGHSIAGKRAWMWVAVCAMFAVFFARSSRKKTVAQEILGLDFSGVLVSDRYPGYAWYKGPRQFCWAHLIRDLVKYKESIGGSSIFANKVLNYVKAMFVLWQGFKAGEITHREVQESMFEIRFEVETLLKEGQELPLAGNFCKQLYELRAALWVFIDVPGVEPTNNDAERTVRTYVIWRKTSFGTQTDRGNEYVERILTVVATRKRQGLKVYEYLVQAMTAHLRGETAPSLLPQPLTA